MMKMLSKFSPIHLVIVLSSFALGIVLRFAFIDVQVPWTDELASLFFTKNLDQIFAGESHTPLYYGILRLFLGDAPTIFSARIFSAFLSLFYLVLFFILGQKVFRGSRFILFWILICLSPVDIIYARQARHYAWLGEHILLFALLLQLQVSAKLLALNTLLSGFIHPFGVIPSVLLSFFDYLKRRDKKKLIILLISSSLFLLYYLVRLFLFGKNHVGNNLSWNHLSSFDFYKSLILIFFGDAYPRNQFFPIPYFAVAAAGLGLTLFFFCRRSKAIGEWLILVLVSVLAVEFLSLIWVNFRTARYLIYLPFLLYYTIALSAKELSDKVLAALLLVLVFYLPLISIITPHPWDDEPIAKYKLLKEENPEASELICANIYQADYYGLNKDHLCNHPSLSLELRKPILLIDFNNDSQGLIISLLETMKPVRYEKFSRGRVILFHPK